MLMNKTIIFDMDGTIADLYNVPSWLEKLRAFDTSPYEDAAPMYDMDSLVEILYILHDLGYYIMVVSWSSKETTIEYSHRIRQAKKTWLERYGFPYDELHVVKYGTPKQNFINHDIAILVDDNERVRASFEKSKRGKKKKTIDAANQNIISELIQILISELET